MKEIRYSKAARLTLRKIPTNWSKRIMSKIEEYARDPASLSNNIVAIQGSNGAIRLRVGDWRIVIEDGVAVNVVKIGARGTIYTKGSS